MDWMHAKYLGHDMMVYGSILSLLCNFVMVHMGTPLQCLQRIWQEIQVYYKRVSTPCRYRYLNKLSMFMRKAPQYPKLRGKAAEVKYLCGAMLHVFNKFHNPNVEVHRQALLYLKLNWQVEEMLVTFRDELSLPAAEAETFESLVNNMLLLLTAIASHLFGDKLFGITQKAHFIQHLAMLSRHLNPRVVWCFMGEDMQKRMSGLGKTCVKCQGPGQTIGKMHQRYRVALQLQLAEHGR